jgi:hypothetical protein
MEGKRAINPIFENRCEEVLADSSWVAKHAEHARTQMLEQVDIAAFIMEMSWQRAMQIPSACRAERWCAVSVLSFVRSGQQPVRSAARATTYARS